MQKLTSKTLEEHREYLYKIVRLKLWFLLLFTPTRCEVL